MKSHKLRLCLLLVVLCSVPAFAHKPLLSVDDNEDGTIYIEVGFSDGSSGSGHDLILKNKEGKVLNELKVPDESSIDVDMPSVPYTVTFYAGPGHEVTVDGPFSESESAAPVETESAAPAAEDNVPTQSVKPATAESNPATSTVAAQPVAVAQPLVVAAPAVQDGPGYQMALKMMLTSNVIIAVFIAVVLVMISFGIGYSIGKSGK